MAELPVEFTGEGQMHLNSLHVAEVLSDDSNFRRRAMDKLAGPLAHVLLQTPQDFAAAWLAGLCPTQAPLTRPSLHTVIHHSLLHVVLVQGQQQ